MVHLCDYIFQEWRRRRSASASAAKNLVAGYSASIRKNRRILALNTFKRRIFNVISPFLGTFIVANIFWWKIGLQWHFFVSEFYRSELLIVPIAFTLISSNSIVYRILLYFWVCSKFRNFFWVEHFVSSKGLIHAALQHSSAVFWNCTIISTGTLLYFRSLTIFYFLNLCGIGAANFRNTTISKRSTLEPSEQVTVWKLYNRCSSHFLQIRNSTRRQFFVNAHGKEFKFCFGNKIFHALWFFVKKFPKTFHLAPLFNSQKETEK